MMKYLSAWCLLALVSLHTASAAPIDQTYCANPDEQAKWGQLLRKYSDDEGVAKLFALRFGLCEMIRAELITVRMANNIFNPEWTALIQERKKPGISPDDDPAVEKLL